MADPTEVKIYHIVGPITSCSPKQFGVNTTVDPVTGFRMWGGKDANGDVTQWLALDKFARVTTLHATTRVLSPMTDFVQMLSVDPANRRVFWDEDEEAPAFYNAVDDVKHILGRSMMTPVCINDTGSPITRGSACRVRQAVGGYPALELATSTTHLFGDLVVFPMRDVADGATVDCLWVGMGEGLNTAGFAANEQLYLSTTPGVLTNVAPANPVFVGRCVVSSSTVGRILYVGTGFGGDLSTFYNKIVDDATAIKMEVGNHDVQHLLDDVIGRGNIDDSGFSFTDDGAGACTIGSGDVYLHTTASKGSTGGVFTVPGDSFTLTDGYNNYIYAEYNAGTPRLQNTINPSAIRYVEDKIIVRIVRRDGTTLRNIPFEPGWQSLSTVLTQQFFEEAEGMGDLFAHRLKGDVISTLGTRSPTLSAGSYRAGLNRIPTPLIDCTAGGTFTSFYGDTANGFTYSTGQTQLNNTQYYNGAGGLATLNTARYSVRWVWRLFSVTEMFIQISATNIIDQADAIDAPIPTDLPPLVAQFGQLVGRYIVQQGSNTVLSLPRWESTLSSSGVVTHASTVDPNSEPDVQHVNSTPTTGQTGTQVLESASIPGSTKKFDVSPQNVRLMKQATNPASFESRSLIPTEKYVFISNDTAGDMYRLDRSSMSVVDSVALTNNWSSKHAVCHDGHIVVFNGSFAYALDIENLSEKAVTISGDTAGSFRGADVSPDGTVYVASPTSISKVTGSVEHGYTSIEVSFAGSLTDEIQDIVCGSDRYYIVDAGWTVRSFSYASDTLINSSSGTLAGSLRGIVRLHDGRIMLLTSSHAYLLASTLGAAIGDYGNVDGSRYSQFYNGLIYGCDVSNIYVHIPMGLTVDTPSIVDNTDADVFYADTRANSTDGLYTQNDFIQAASDVQSLQFDQLGCTVLSVEATLPGSPAIGATYLMSGGTTIHEGYVIRWTAHGEWEVLARDTGSRVTVQSTRDVYDWTGSAWEQSGILTYVQKTDLTDGGTTTLHQHAPTVIDVDEVTYPDAYVISASDQNNVIYLNHACTAGYAVEVPDSILAIPGFRFYVSIVDTQLNANVWHESTPAFGYVMTVPGSGYINTCEFMVVGGKITLISGAATEK